MTDEKADRSDAHPYLIKVTTDGPYLVTGGVPLSEQVICVDDDGQPHGWKQGRAYPLHGDYALCRCGRSRQMPFCDGSHMEAGFDGTETALDTPYLEQAERIDGPGLDLTDAETLCAGSAFCHRAGGTWALTRRSADPEARQNAVEEAGECPSGRLVAWGKDGQAIEPDFESSIGLVVEPHGRMGPVWVRGGTPIQSADGKTYEVRNRVTLCRCGRSYNKPFCDGGHQE